MVGVGVCNFNIQIWSVSLQASYNIQQWVTQIHSAGWLTSETSGRVHWLSCLFSASIFWKKKTLMVNQWINPDKFFVFCFYHRMMFSFYPKKNNATLPESHFICMERDWWYNTDYHSFRHSINSILNAICRHSSHFDAVFGLLLWHTFFNYFPIVFLCKCSVGKWKWLGEK